MNNTEIKKILNYLDNGKIDEAKFMLKTELIRCCDKSKASQVKLVEKYLKSAQKLTCRPTCGTVMHYNGKQFLCNGCSLIVFNKTNDSLDILPQTEEKFSLPYPQILKTATFRTQTSEETKILKSLKKYIEFCNIEKLKYANLPVQNRTFNASLLLETLQIFNSKIEDIEIGFEDENSFSPVHFRTDEIEAIVLPLRPDEKQKNLSVETFEKFNNLLEN